MHHDGPGRARGLLISFDGVDSSGKETQAKALVDRLRYQGYTVHQFVTPDYTTPSGRDLKLRLQGKKGDWEHTSWEEKMRYFATNRAEHKEEVLAALDKGEMVVYDRYVPSSLAFVAIEALLAQEVAVWREDVYNAVRDYEYGQHKMPVENVSIFLDVPPKVSAELLEKRKEKLQDEDEYTDHLHFQERLYNEYLELLKAMPERFLRIPCLDGNELLPIEATQELVWEGLAQRFPALKARKPNSPASGGTPLRRGKTQIKPKDSNA